MTAPRTKHGAARRSLRSTPSRPTPRREPTPMKRVLPLALILAVASVSLGGCGNIPGAIAGGFAIGVLDSFAAGHFQGYSELVVFLVFTVAIMIRPTGLFGETTVSRA